MAVAALLAFTAWAASSSIATWSAAHWLDRFAACAASACATSVLPCAVNSVHAALAAAGADNPPDDEPEPLHAPAAAVDATRTAQRRRRIRGRLPAPQHLQTA